MKTHNIEFTEGELHLIEAVMECHTLRLNKEGMQNNRNILDKVRNILKQPDIERP